MGLGLVAEHLRLDVQLPRGRTARVLDVERLAIGAGEAVGITGPSGCGKTSLLHCVTGIARPTAGRVSWSGTDLTSLGERERDAWRRRAVGLVFQDFHLFPGLSAIDNVLLPATFTRFSIPARLRERARELLRRVGLGDARGHLAVLSRGEQQRVAIARALLFSPPLIVADEPTASLDAESSRIVSGLLVGVCQELGSTLVVATHDAGLLARLDRVHQMVEGRLRPLHAAAAAAP